MTRHWFWITGNAFFAGMQLWATTLHDNHFWFYVAMWPFFCAMGGYWVWAYFEDRDDPWLNISQRDIERMLAFSQAHPSVVPSPTETEGK